MSQSNIRINLDSLKARREWKRHKVKDGSNVFRILPPFGDQSNGYAYKKWQIIWGLKDPESGRPRPFASSMTSEKKCPVTEYVQALKKKSESLKAQMASSGLTEEVQKERLGALNKLISDLTPKTVYIYNAVDKAGEVGLLELKSTAQKKMKSEMVQYIQDYNQDPTSLNSDDLDSGVWFNITRTGLGRDTEYDVKKMQIKTKNPNTGKISFEDDRSPLPDAVVENYTNLAYDLSAVYQVKSYDDLAEILQANMLDLIEICPDADLNADGLLLQQVPSTTESTQSSVKKATGKKPVTLKMDDVDDEEEQVDSSVQNANRSKSASLKASNADDEFMALADALLN